MGMKDKFQDQSEQWKQQAKQKAEQGKEQVPGRGKKRPGETSPERTRRPEQEESERRAPESPRYSDDVI
ncbi:hypothetical protein SAMN04487983_101673 [Streptomyces sp. yr375]|uniref:hypothetical protein n=1 Tax=Streptomyces sp. yr375 TaxID=1761906 RepID=UPI0008BDB098|nr:hypothetical protein [Streptomyces sp. yr375]SER43665.1 hypothetical protein SAMN04487983_101673 [Streptomyces sp. yr375]